MACKITTAPLIGIILLVAGLRIASTWPQAGNGSSLIWREALKCAGAAVTAVLMFRVAQPYAFQGPGFWDLSLNSRWLEIMREVQRQVSGRAEWPPNHHWTDRPMLTYAWQNLVMWGLGLPLGLAASLGWIWMAWRCWRGPHVEWQRHLLPLVWVGGYFAWQNLQFWSYLRYFMPLLPLAVLVAAWAMVTLVGRVSGMAGRGARRARTLAIGVMVVVLGGTAVYAVAFGQIYARPHTRVQASRWILANVPGPVNVLVETSLGLRQYPLSFMPGLILGAGQSWQGSFRAEEVGTVVAITAVSAEFQGEVDRAAVAFRLVHDGAEPRTLARIAGDLGQSSPGEPNRFPIEGIQVEPGQLYTVALEVREGGSFTLRGSRLAMETAWDDALPLRVDGHDPLGGIYQTLDLQLFEPDTEEKREHLLRVLEQADLIVVSSNRAYDAMPRLPLRYPMTTAYYQALFDCPDHRIHACAYPAQAPESGRLGFDLVATFESKPSFGPLSISDQSAEEAFTVYDHPKVLLFQKNADFDVQQARELLSAVDLSAVIEQGPVQATRAPTALQLPPGRWLAQTRGGTWSAMFDTQDLLNRHAALAVVAWYGLLVLLGWVTFPLVWTAMPGLPDRGYPLARIIGLLVVSWFAWMAASLRWLPFTRGVLWSGAGALVLVSALLTRRPAAQMLLWLRSHWRHLLLAEGLFLALFMFLLLVRWHNPDLWQPWRGGEKPMDMAYLNAVMKSTYFPPYDPWMAGNMLNYYYYGYVLVATPTKMLGVVPAVAYNLALPSWYAMAALGVFSAAWNLAFCRPASRKRAWLAGAVAVLLMVLLGNLAQVRVIWDRLVEIGAPANLRLPWFHQIGDLLRGIRAIPFGTAELIGEDLGRWYFSASRAILHYRDGTPITEFPLFTFLYGDLHPHMMNMPVLLAGLGWVLSLVLRRRPLRLTTWLVGGLIVGAAYPTHSWDLLTVSGLALLALAYRGWQLRPSLSRDGLMAVAVQSAGLLLLAVGLYWPFHQWFGSDYAAAELWRGPRTPLMDYLSVHGLFLFLMGTWLAVLSTVWVHRWWRAFWHTRLGTLLPALGRRWWLVLGAPMAVAAGATWLMLNDYPSMLLALPLVAWVLALLMSHGRSPAERSVLALVAAGLALTGVVEVLVLRGDVGRSNTVFKFYIQVWTFFSVAAGAAAVWMLPALGQWRLRSRRLFRFWRATLILLLLAAASYPLLAIRARIADRWPDLDGLPRTMDGMAYMLGNGPDQPAVYRDEGRPLNLAADHAGIRWMQEHIEGSPVIVEGLTPEYRWGSRFSIYTGLPAVVGWSWHVRQHNAVVPGVVVERRIDQVRQFYETTQVADALAFLHQYDVHFIVVGDLERAYYPADGLAKFERMVSDGHLVVAFESGPAAPGLRIYQRAMGG
jgi:YYY domain-containing protein